MEIELNYLNKQKNYVWEIRINIIIIVGLINFQLICLFWLRIHPPSSQDLSLVGVTV